MGRKLSLVPKGLSQNNGFSFSDSPFTKVMRKEHAPVARQQLSSLKEHVKRIKSADRKREKQIKVLQGQLRKISKGGRS